MSVKNNKKLFDGIRNCEGVNGCYGEKHLFHPIPVVLPNYGGPKIMIITEQPREFLEKDRFVQLIKENKRVPGKLGEFLDKDEFSDNIENESGKYYWTHFIKCPGQIREVGKKRRKKIKKRMNPDACAEKHLVKEIQALKPDLILTFGASPSSWILKKFVKESEHEEWRAYFWDELQEVVEYEQSKEKQDLETMLRNLSKIRITVDGKDIPVCVFYHPSEANPAAYFTEKIFEVLNKKKQ